MRPQIPAGQNVQVDDTAFAVESTVCDEKPFAYRAHRGELPDMASTRWYQVSRLVCGMRMHSEYLGEREYGQGRSVARRVTKIAEALKEPSARARRLRTWVRQT